MTMVAGGVPSLPPPPPPPPSFANAYTLSGSDGTSPGGSLDGVYALVDAQCRPYPDGSSSCDTGSPTTCGSAPTFQRGGAGGPVLLRSRQERTDNQGFQSVRIYWTVTDSSALTNCGNGVNSMYALRSQDAVEYPDSDVDSAWVETEPRAWRDGGYRESHANADLTIVAGGGGH